MMCYLGNKTKLLTFIEKVIDKYKIEEKPLQTYLQELVR